MNIPQPPRELTPEEIQIIDKFRDKMEKFQVYTIKDGELVVKVDELKDRYVTLDFESLIPPNAFELDGEDEEPLPPSAVEELANKKLYGKEEIMKLLGCGNQKALNFLKLLFQMQYAIKIGKSYIVRAEDFDKFFEDFKGQEIVI